MTRIRITFVPDESLIETVDGVPEISEETWLELHSLISPYAHDLEIEVIA